MNLEAALADLAEPAPPGLAERIAAAAQAWAARAEDAGDELFAVDGPAGPLWVAFGPHGVSLVWSSAPAATQSDHSATLSVALDVQRAFATRYPERGLHRAATPPPALVAALAGDQRAARRLGYDLTSCSPFQRAVLAKTAEIPRGEVRSYGWIAKEIGQDKAVRAVGTALGRNPVPVLIPCHRVVRSDGKIGNYALGPGVKERLLAAEGVDLPSLAELAAAGVRYVGSATTHIFCVPTCHAAQRIRSGNRTLFRTEGDAARAGYRPCRRCRPAHDADHTRSSTA